MKVNYQGRLESYLPPSAHKESDDSLDIVEMSREGPRPIQLDPSNYELTFKKNEKEKYFVGEREVQRSLLTASERQMLGYLGQNLTYYYSLKIDQLSSFPFADLYSLDLQEKQQRKLTLIGQILQLRRLQAKNRSVGLNLRCLSLKQNLSHEEKNKAYLLELLQKQLNKKQFIQSLRLNSMHNKYVTLYGDESEVVQYHPTNPELLERDHIEEQDEVEVQRQWKSYSDRWEQPSQEEHLESQLEGQLLIFTQVISSITKKQLFSAFASILSANRNAPKTLHPLQAGDLSPIPTAYKKEMTIKSPQVLSNELIEVQKGQQQYFPEDGEIDNNMVDQLECQQSKLAQLHGYMQQLHEECAETDSIARKYFLKWKIFLLEAIAQSMIYHIQGEEEPINSLIEAQHHPEEPSQMIDSSKYHKDQLSIEQQPQCQHFHQEQDIYPHESIHQDCSRKTSEISQFQSSLKHQKREVKQMIFRTEAKLFLNNLRAKTESNKINEIIQQMRVSKILKIGLDAFKMNAMEHTRLKNMDRFYEQIADNQIDDDNTAFFFWKTNLLHKYFRQLQEYRRNLKIYKTMATVTMRLAFRIVRSEGLLRKRNEETIDRWVELRKRKYVFKYFNLWKQQFRTTTGSYQKVRGYKALKEKELKNHCFSILKLCYKKMLVKSVRAQQFYKQSLKSLAFESLKIVTEEDRELRGKEQNLHSYLIFKRSGRFLSKLFIFYEEYIQYQRFIVKEEKLKRTLLGIRVLKGINSWRAAHMKKTAYSAIEARLTRLKQKQRKREILSLWARRALGEISSSRLSESNQHKQWLVQYYSGLCSVYQE